MEETISFDALLERLRAGEGGAFGECFQRFGQRLLGLARARLQERLRTKVDAEDVVQSVFKSFCQGCREDDWEFKSWDNLWSLLVVLTLRKCHAQADRFRAQRRDVRREVPLAVTPDADDSPWPALTREPSPSHAAILTETVEQVMGALDSQEREILSLRLQGYSAAEIGAAVGRTERTVYRVLERVKSILTKSS